MTKLIFALSSVLLLAACGDKPADRSAGTASETVMASAGGGAVFVEGKGEISKNRTTAFKSFMPTFSDIRKMANGDQAFVQAQMKAKAELFTKEAREPFEYFQNDPEGNGDALPAVWQKPDEFKTQQAAFLAAVDELNAAAQTGKLDGIKVAVSQVSASCKSCHEAFRRPK